VGNDGMALLVVIGLGGLVLWYLMRQQPGQQPLTTQGQPCAVSYAGVTASCGAVEKGLNFIKDKVLPLTPIGAIAEGHTRKINGVEVSDEEFKARTGCGGSTVQIAICLGKKNKAGEAGNPLKSETQTYNGVLNLKIGKAPSLGSVVNVPPGPPKPPPASKPMGFR
jgi:hypothetical protein